MADVHAVVLCVNAHISVAEHASKMAATGGRLLLLVAVAMAAGKSICQTMQCPAHNAGNV